MARDRTHAEGLTPMAQNRAHAEADQSPAAHAPPDGSLRTARGLGPCMMEGPFPLEGIWRTFSDRVADAAPPVPTTITRDTYLDLAERIVRSLAAWQDEHGLIMDPWAADRYYVTNRDGHRVLVHAQARYLGALGQLLRAGRCRDLLEDGGIAAYEERLRHLDEVERAPEFYTKELVWAHLGMREHVAPQRRRRWEEVWAAHAPWQSYRCARTGQIDGHNYAVFAAAGEFIKEWAGLGGDRRLVEEALAYLAGDFTEYGMYRDPGDPMTYSLVVLQQLDLMRHLGYHGPTAGWLEEICRRGAITTLLTQSSCGQMPFGGRSNQFHFVEAHFACLCETRAAWYRQRGERTAAAVFRRAGRRAAALTRPWILEMEPFRHTKQGFHPRLGHGVDSGGPYSVYGALAASLFATAYHLAEDGRGHGMVECLTPAEAGGYAFALWPAFHKVFAAAGGYSVQVDTRADLEKDATGLGRLHRSGVRPETALSGSIAAGAAYDTGVSPPQAHLAIGPAWRTGDRGKHPADASVRQTAHQTASAGPDEEAEDVCPKAPRDVADEAGPAKSSAKIAEVRLAAFSVEIHEVRLCVLQADAECVRFEIAYEGDLGGCRRVIEQYRLTGAGLEYRVRAEPEPESLCVLVPVIASDGEADAEMAETPADVTVCCRSAAHRVAAPSGVTVTYRGEVYEIATPPDGQWRLRRDPPAANRNALYRTLEVRGAAVRLSLTPAECEPIGV